MNDGQEAKEQPPEPEGQEPKLALGTEADLKDALQPFLSNNPEIEFEFIRRDDKEVLFLKKPWGDSTLMTIVREDGRDEFIQTVNDLRLPPRMSALWHKKTGDLEVIWTAYRLNEEQQEIAGRKFTYHDGGTDYECEFGKSSDALLALARRTFPISTPTETDFRNLTSFHLYVFPSPDDEEEEELSSVDEPRSVWIRKVALKEDDLPRFINRLNFYLTYFDSRSPYILVHAPANPGSHEKRCRYIRDDFPKEINALKLDDNVLSFWLAAQLEGTVLKYILYFRIIEYAAHHHLDMKMRHKLSRILSDPAGHRNKVETVERLLESLDPSRTDETTRFKSVIEELVDPKFIWDEIQRNKAAFTKDVVCDGGYLIKAISHESETFETFSKGGLSKFAERLKHIRNVLAHGRDQTTGKVITPTARNIHILEPWVGALHVAAGEVATYESNV